MSTTTRVNLMKTIITRVMGYSYGGTTVGTLTGNRVYVSQAPDDTLFPCVVLRAINGQTSPEYQNAREQFDLEVMCYGRPRSSEQGVEQIADLVTQALITWTDGSSGVVFGRSVQRSTIPPVGDASDRELVTVRLVVDVTAWSLSLVGALQA